MYISEQNIYASSLKAEYTKTYTPGETFYFFYLKCYEMWSLQWIYWPCSAKLIL